MADEPDLKPSPGMTVEECQNMIQRSLRTPMVKFLKEHLEKSGCGIGSNFIKAVNCKGATAGGYVKGEGIVVCSNHLQIQDEIRAGHLSGDCHYKRELLRGFMKLRGHEQDFVRRRVMKSVTANPYCSEASAKDAMEAVWDICYNNTKPFDRAP
ncbi:Ku70-binding family protein [Striga hermonthica]|uniref:Mitochondrial inner membrane protease ATP23 n=1 Tax=Striga hermonthica TaxID=68872 RepID=A0A9N7RQC4_STRHE|nr:Ku70-binding family protein [Striga hermonthica]